MIKNKIFALLLGVVLVMGMSSCENYFGDINENPNSPTDATPDVILPGIEVRIAFTLGGDVARYSSVIVQHVEGYARQWSSINSYASIVPVNFNTLWGFNLYAGALLDLQILEEKAATSGSNHYEGIAKVLSAYTWMITTDLFGDVPYSEAFQGTDVLSPSFDSQEFVYTEIHRLLDEGITLLGQDATGLTPGGDDVIFGGDADAWVKFAHGVKARAYLHTALQNSGNYASALAELNSAAGSADDDARVQFGASATTAAPFYQFNRDRGDIRFNPDMNDLMVNLVDTMRANMYGTDFIDPPEQHPVLVPDRAYPLYTYTEQKFMEAECLMMSGGSDADIHAAYLAGIESSFAELGLSASYADYVANADVDPGAGSVTMEHIMTQKYIALWTQPESFNDWRRTGIPTLTPNSGSTVPVRFPYSEEEVLYNSNTPAVDIFTDKVWWDN